MIIYIGEMICDPVFYYPDNPKPDSFALIMRDMCGCIVSLYKLSEELRWVCEGLICEEKCEPVFIMAIIMFKMLDYFRSKFETKKQQTKTKPELAVISSVGGEMLYKGIERACFDDCFLFITFLCYFLFDDGFIFIRLFIYLSHYYCFISIY